MGSRWKTSSRLGELVVRDNVNLSLSNALERPRFWVRSTLIPATCIDHDTTDRRLSRTASVHHGHAYIASERSSYARPTDGKYPNICVLSNPRHALLTPCISDPSRGGRDAISTPIQTSD